MSKYIPAEKLIAEIGRIVEEETPISKGSDYYHGVADTADKLLSFITYLQQDEKALELIMCNQAYWEDMGYIMIPPNVTLDGIETLLKQVRKKLQSGNICPRCVYRNKTDDLCEYPYGGRKCSINENGVYECNGFEETEQQDQPEVDLEKDDIIDYVHSHFYYDKDFDGYGHSELRPVFTRDDVEVIARHFYELGLAARKGE